MKKVCISFLFILIICLAAVTFSNTKKTGAEEYLRIHVRANSNSAEDQAVKYEIKDLVVSYLTNIVLASSSKEELVQRIENSKSAINALIDGYLKQKGFVYTAKTEINNELFPTRTYEDLTLESGYYDAVIIKLGAAEGDNWWCVVYPPLCFTEQRDVKYRSLIYEYIQKFFNKNQRR